MKKHSLVFSICLAAVIGCQRPLPANGDAKSGTPDVSSGELAARGRLLVNAMGCNDCHSPKQMTEQGPVPDTSRLLSGHPSGEKLPSYDKNTAAGYILFSMGGTAAVGPWGTSFAGNLTPDETGIGSWTETQFFKAMREGKWKGLDSARTLLPPMPWPAYGQLPDEDLRAIFAYLKSIKPVKNVVPAPLPPNR